MNLHVILTLNQFSNLHPLKDQRELHLMKLMKLSRKNVIRQCVPWLNVDLM